MNIKLSLSKDTAAFVEKALKDQITKLKEDSLKLEEAIRAKEMELIDIRAALNGNVNMPEVRMPVNGRPEPVTAQVPEAVKYNKKGTTSDKIRYILSNSDEALTSSEIIDLIIEREPKLSGNAKAKLAKDVSSLISGGIPKNLFKAVENINGGRRKFTLV